MLFSVHSAMHFSGAGEISSDAAIAQQSAPGGSSSKETFPSQLDRLDSRDLQSAMNMERSSINDDQLILPYLVSTSSTAQGGGGSFKNRKPIGEVGCCESRMPERSHWWTDRWLRSPLFLSFSLSLTIYLSTYLPIYLSTYLSNLITTHLI